MSENEVKFYDALKRITQYDSVERLRKDCENRYGIRFEEALEYSYENVINEAQNAIRRKRRPGTARKRDAPLHLSPEAKKTKAEEKPKTELSDEM